MKQRKPKPAIKSTLEDGQQVVRAWDELSESWFEIRRVNTREEVLAVIRDERVETMDLGEAA